MAPSQVLAFSFAISIGSQIRLTSAASRHFLEATGRGLRLNSKSDRATLRHKWAEGPRPSGWFGGFSEAESTYTVEGLDTHESPEWRVLEGHDPSSQLGFGGDQEVLGHSFFHESQSSRGYNAWQSHYPAVKGTIGGNHGASTENPWRYTPSGWVQDYETMGDVLNPSFSLDDLVKPMGPKVATWFDNDINQIDGFGRNKLPNKDAGRRYLARGWLERSVNTTITCNKPGCAAAAKLSLFDGATEDAKLCRISIFVHPTDYDDDYSREHVEYWKINGHVADRQCNPQARGCNSTAERPLYPCLNSFPVDRLVKSDGTVLLEGKNSPMVDECPYKKNLLSAVAMATCMVANKTTTTTTTTNAAAAYALAGQNGSAILKCETPGCEAETTVHFNPVDAINGGKCSMSINVTQTDYDDKLGVKEEVEFLSVEGKNIKKSIEPGKNPCNIAYKGKNVTSKDMIYEAVKKYDVTKLVNKSRPLGSLTVKGKISKHVDECGYDNKYLFYAHVQVECTPPSKYTTTTKKKR